MKKRIFISIHYMELGGGEMSLIGLLHAIDYTRYDVDLFIQSHQGELMQFIPKDVNVLPEIPEYANVETPIKDVVKRGLYRVAWARLKSKWQYRRYLKKEGLKESSAIYGIIERNLNHSLPSLHHLGRYDLAISYLGMGLIVKDKVLADKKIIWLHSILI